MLTRRHVPFQSTYCSTMVQHVQTLNRSVQVVNLDPAAEHFDYPVTAGERRTCLKGVKRTRCHYTV